MARATLLAAVVVMGLALSLAVPALGDPTYCLEYSDRSSDCNCHTCDCEVCHTCECSANYNVFSPTCRHDACPGGCWCSAVCTCCYESNCRSECNCHTCCDTCTTTECSRHVTYSVHSISPTFVLAAAPTPITVTGGYFVGTPLLQCKFGTATVPATLVSNNALQCTPPTALLGAGQTSTVAVAVSLDGEQWTTNNVTLTYTKCPDDCLGHGHCDALSHCVCDTGYTGYNCSKVCPVGGAGVTCSGRGACTLGGHCQCNDGYWGPSCSGVCPVGLGGLVCSGADHGLCDGSSGLCVCLEGFTGDTCQHTGTCEQHGTTCECTENGYWGPGCSNVCPGSSGCVEGSGCQATCSGHGLCTSNGQCVCDAGFYGSACERACPSSNGLPCSGHASAGTCDRAGNCVCAAGWTGSDCSMECPGGEASPCNNRGVCTRSGLCICSSGYAGLQCQLECPSVGNLPCAGHGTCTEAGTCGCSRGYYGTSCENTCAGGAASPCNGHGNCDSSGKCVCELGYYGSECATQCPGGAANPCSGHGTCDSHNGVCGCNVGYWGSDCASACPQHDGKVCGGQGACGTDGTCKCNAPYTGTSCETVYCPYDCYNHGSCDEQGVCHCQGPWSGVYCSTQQGVDPLTGGHASFQFQNGFVRTREDAGTIYLNVSRGGSTFGEVYVWYQTADASAHAGSDYMPTSGRLVWVSGESLPKTIPIVIIGDDHPEGLEAFIVYLHSPSPGSTVGENATVTISANGDASSATDSAIVTVKVKKPEEQLRLNTATGAAFANQFIADLCGPNVLHISTDRMVVRDVQSSGPSESFLTFVLLGDPKGPATDSLAQIIWEQMQDVTSALYKGQASRYIDMDYQPVFKFSLPPAEPDTTTYWWLIPVFIVLALIAGCAVVGYRKRVVLTEWMLWRLGNFRFNTLMRHRNLDLDVDEDRSAAGSDRRRPAPGDEITDTRL